MTIHIETVPDSQNKGKTWLRIYEGKSKMIFDLRNIDHVEFCHDMLEAIQWLVRKAIEDIQITRGGPFNVPKQTEKMKEILYLLKQAETKFHEYNQIIDDYTQ